MKNSILAFLIVFVSSISVAQFTDVAPNAGINTVYQGTAPGAGVSFVDANQVLDIKQESATSTDDTPDIESPAGLVVYPNPSAGGSLWIENAAGHVIETARLFSSSGREIQVSFTANLQKRVLLTLGEKVTGGIYFLHLQTQDHYFIEKVIIR